MKLIRALVLDDSVICRIRLKDILEAERTIQVVGEAANGDGVLELIERTRPDVLLVDLEMPGTAGHETIELVMANQPLPILVVTGLPETTRQAEVFESIRRGALELAAKPLGGDRVAEANLRSQVRQLASIPVVRHVAGKLGRPRITRSNAPPPRPSDLGPVVPLIGIGASAGGPIALANVLSGLPEDLPAAVAVVQHLPVGFARGFADFLRMRAACPVSLVVKDTRLMPGNVYVATDDLHLVLSDPGTLCSLQAPPTGGHRPSVDVLFHSIARHQGRRAAGVVLSGMGRDGAEGLLAMRQAGALTLAQDESSSGVYGMPMAATKNGAAASSHPPAELAHRLLDWARTNYATRQR